MNLKDLIADVNVNEIYEHIETETLSEWVNAWQKAALSAFRPVSREKVEKVWRGEWIKKDGYTECSKCEYWYDSPENEDDGDRLAFCPNCGAPMTDEAVDIRLKELEALKDADD